MRSSTKWFLFIGAFAVGPLASYGQTLDASSIMNARMEMMSQFLSEDGLTTFSLDSVQLSPDETFTGLTIGDLSTMKAMGPAYLTAVDENTLDVEINLGFGSFTGTATDMNGNGPGSFELKDGVFNAKFLVVFDDTACSFQVNSLAITSGTLSSATDGGASAERTLDQSPSLQDLGSQDSVKKLVATFEPCSTNSYTQFFIP